MKKPRSIGLVGFFAVALLLAACSGQTGNARIASPQPSGVEVLTIGLLLDNTGDQSFLNPAQQAAAKLAVQQLNLAGGVNGQSVELLPSDPADSIADQLRKLSAGKASVVIGPTDSAQASEAIAALSKSRTVLISPANAATALNKVSSGGYYFRTAPVETMQAKLLARLAADSAKGQKIAVLYESADSSKEIAQQVISAVADSGAQQTVSIEASDAAAAAAKVKAEKAGSVVVIARQRSQQILAELANAQVPGSTLLLDDGATSSYGANLALNALQGAQGILPGVFPPAAFQEELLKIDPALTSLNYAAESYDAVMLSALAAIRAKDSSGASIASRLIEVSGGSGNGQKCQQLSDCLSLLSQGKAIDYDGVSGPVNFDDQGNITVANYLVYRYGAGNLPVLNRSEQVK
ncbi:ABC transporter substrate-binding protein [Psychromicrobium sp. YIM B11713]|uniref:ABC transporter substrate-binding protein n=1 Tax=Psychromicrobium sp. YIM B11713 TaxID=3145233 RepID=UPI00374F05BF